MNFRHCNELLITYIGSGNQQNYFKKTMYCVVKQACSINGTKFKFDINMFWELAKFVFFNSVWRLRKRKIDRERERPAIVNCNNYNQEYTRLSEEDQDFPQIFLTLLFEPTKWICFLKILFKDKILNWMARDK